MLKHVTETELDMMHETAKKMSKGNTLVYYILINLQLKSLAWIGIKEFISEKWRELKERIFGMFK